MPKSVLRIVAAILAACAVTGFVMGVRSAPEPSTLPGEIDGAGQAIPAREFQPLNTDPPPPPPAPEPEEKAEEAPAEKAEPAPAPAPAPAEKAAPTVTPPPPAAPPADNVGDLIDGLTPPPDQPPF